MTITQNSYPLVSGYMFELFSVWDFVNKIPTNMLIQVSYVFLLGCLHSAWVKA